MRRRATVRVAAGLVLLVLALGLAFVAHGVAEARSAFGHLQAQWQRGLAEAPATAPGRAQRVGEALLGIGARSDLLRAYQDYRAGTADVIPGTVYPQTRARWEAIGRLRNLTKALSTSEDRASANVVLGAIFAAGVATPGEQRAVETNEAIAAFTRAVLEDPANATAKLDLEVELRTELDRERASARARAGSSSASRRRQRQQDPRGPAIPAQAEGSGY